MHPFTHARLKNGGSAWAKADIIISATADPGFVITAADMKRLATERKGRKLVMIDLALPRDIDPAVREFEGVLLYDLEDLERAVEPRISNFAGSADAEKSFFPRVRIQKAVDGWMSGP